MKHFDALIIGSGKGGTPLAKKLAKNGWKTALVEKNKVGGTCVNAGCTPTKTMIASAKTAYTVNGSAKYGIHLSKFQTSKLAERLISIFKKDENGKRLVHDTVSQYQNDPHFKDLVLFYEYFHGDNCRGVGASHQTGWTGIIAELINRVTNNKVTS